MAVQRSARKNGTVDAYDPSLKLLVDKLGQFYMYAYAEFT